MDTKILATISFLIAFLCHLVLFNLCVIVFAIDAAPPKPNLFFLGTILKQSDLLPASSPKNGFWTGTRPFTSDVRKSSLPDMDYQPKLRETNPFSIRPISKPIPGEIPDSRQKVIVKSTFDTMLTEPSEKGKERGEDNPEPLIPPYKPLQFHLP